MSDQDSGHEDSDQDSGGHEKPSETAGAGQGQSEEDREAANLAAQERFFELDVEMKSTMVELKKRGSDMEEVQEEFEKLYRSFTNVHNSELRYSKRATELTNDIRAARGKRLVVVVAGIMSDGVM